MIDPLGKIILDLGSQEETFDLDLQEKEPFEGKLGFVEIDDWISNIKKVREGMPVFDHKRSDLYDVITKKD